MYQETMGIMRLHIYPCKFVLCAQKIKNSCLAGLFLMWSVISDKFEGVLQV